MNLVAFTRSVTDEVEKITNAIKWPEITGIATSYLPGHDLRGVFVVRLTSHNRSIQHVATNDQIEEAHSPIIPYIVVRAFEQLYLAEQGYAKERHDAKHKERT